VAAAGGDVVGDWTFEKVLNISDQNALKINAMARKCFDGLHDLEMAVASRDFVSFREAARSLVKSFKGIQELFEEYSRFDLQLREVQSQCLKTISLAGIAMQKKDEENYANQMMASAEKMADSLRSLILKASAQSHRLSRSLTQDRAELLKQLRAYEEQEEDYEDDEDDEDPKEEYSRLRPYKNQPRHATDFNSQTTGNYRLNLNELPSGSGDELSTLPQGSWRVLVSPKDRDNYGKYHKKTKRIHDEREKDEGDIKRKRSGARKVDKDPAKDGKPPAEKEKKETPPKVLNREKI